MSVEIEIVTGAAAWPSVKPLFDLAWPMGARDGLFAAPELSIIVEDDGEPVCHVGLIRREGIWKERKTRIGGVGGVVTHPAHRRRGLASVALTAALQTLKDERATDFALLFCDEAASGFFTARNWKPFVGDVFAQQDGARARFDRLLPMVSYLKRAPHEGELDLCGLPW